MATPNRHNISYLREQLPSLTIAQSGDAIWANLWFGINDAGQRHRVATMKVDGRIYELAETDYHKEVLNGLLDEFAKLRCAGKEKVGHVAKADAPNPTPTVAKPAKKVTKKKAKA